MTGFASATWAALVPFVKARANIDDGRLGLLLLCLGIGSIATMPLSGILTARFGCRRVITIAALAFAAMLPLLGTLSAVPWLVVSLMLFGAGIGAADIAMNVQAILVERASGRAMMSGFHGLFSVGGIAGAGGMAGLLSAGLAPAAAARCASLVIVIALVVAYRDLVPYGSKSDGPAFAIPRGIVAVIGVLCFVLFLTEGAILDWSAVFLTSVRHVAASFAGLGYAVFAATMTLGRLGGDRIVQRFGSERVLVAGGLCAAIGFIVAAALPSPVVALIGFALVGIGCSNIVPLLFSAAGNQREMPETAAVPAVTTIGYAGILAGPAAIGIVAQATSLPTCFAILACMLVAVSLSGRLLRSTAL